MLRKDSIREWGDFPSAIRVKGRITLDMIQAALSNEESGLPTIGIPVKYEREQIQSGGLFNKQVEDCLLVKNANHMTDYFHFVFTVRTTGAVTTIGVYYTGYSPNSGQKSLKESRQKSSSMFDNILGAFTKTDDRAFEEEYDYYAMVVDVLKSTFGV